MVPNIPEKPHNAPFQMKDRNLIAVLGALVVVGLVAGAAIPKTVE